MVLTAVHSGEDTPYFFIALRSGPGSVVGVDDVVGVGVGDGVAAGELVADMVGAFEVLGLVEPLEQAPNARTVRVTASTRTDTAKTSGGDRTTMWGAGRGPGVSTVWQPVPLLGGPTTPAGAE
jgi:hypothetical protein